MISEISSFGHAYMLAKIFLYQDRHDVYQGLVHLVPALASSLPSPPLPSPSDVTVHPVWPQNDINWLHLFLALFLNKYAQQ